MTPRFLSPGNVARGKREQRRLNAAGEFLGFLRLVVQRDLLDDVVQLENGFLRAGVFARRHVQRVLGLGEVQVVGFHAGDARERRGVGVDGKKQVGLLLVGQRRALLRAGRRCRRCGCRSPRRPCGLRSVCPGAWRRPAPGPFPAGPWGLRCPGRGRRGRGRSPRASASGPARASANCPRCWCAARLWGSRPANRRRRRLGAAAGSASRPAAATWAGRGFGLSRGRELHAQARTASASGAAVTPWAAAA